MKCFKIMLTVLMGVSGLTLTGCHSPSQANIKLRKQNQELTDKLEECYRRHAADMATMRALQSTTQPALNVDRLQQVCTVAGIKVKTLTGSTRFNFNSPNDDGIKVYVVPFDQADDEIKAYGSFQIEAYDLQSSDNPLVGRWNFASTDAKKLWFGKGLLYEYILPCAWKTLPDHENITLKVTFTDELTGRRFDEQKVVKIKIPPKTETSAAP